jgi:hypothetical protein
MRPTTTGLLLAVPVCALFGCGPDPEPGAKVASLRAYLGKDLTKLQEAEEKALLKTIADLVPGQEAHENGGYRPRHVWEMPNGGRPLLLLFEVHDLFIHPGSTNVRLTGLDGDGMVVAGSELTTGWRCYLEGASLDEQGGGRDPFVVLATGPFFGPDFRKQVYARFGDRFDLVRLEGDNGKAARNDYSTTHHLCGPEVLNQAQAEWEADLLSSDRLRILRALVWLGGVHLRPKPDDRPDTQYEPPEQRRLVAALRASRAVARRLKELTASRDLWVREAAALAARPEDVGG